MSKLIELVRDAYPYGCKGDVVKLTTQEVTDLQKLGKKLNVGTLYKDFEAVAEQATDDSKEEASKVEEAVTGKKTK